MKNFEQEVGHAVRVEYFDKTDTVYVVFEITHPKLKREIITTWTQDDIEFNLNNKTLTRKVF